MATGPVGSSIGIASPGISFSTPPLVLAGQIIPGSVNFDLPLAGLQTDQAAAAYAANANAIANATGFVSGMAGAAQQEVAAAQANGTGFIQGVIGSSQGLVTTAGNNAMTAVFTAGNNAYSEFNPAATSAQIRLGNAQNSVENMAQNWSMPPIWAALGGIANNAPAPQPVYQVPPSGGSSFGGGGGIMSGIGSALSGIMGMFGL